MPWVLKTTHAQQCCALKGKMKVKEVANKRMMKDLMGVKRHVIWCCHDCVLLSKISINIYGGGATIKMTKVDLNLGEKYMTTM
jgi:hypothetical protein